MYLRHPQSSWYYNEENTWGWYSDPCWWFLIPRSARRSQGLFLFWNKRGCFYDLLCVCSEKNSSNFQDFASIFRKLPHKHKIVIVGNHELTFEEDKKNSRIRGYFGTQPDQELKKYNVTNVKDLFTNVNNLIYLHDGYVEVCTYLSTFVQITFIDFFYWGDGVEIYKIEKNRSIYAHFKTSIH